MRVALCLALFFPLSSSSCCWCDSETPTQSIQGSDNKTYQLVFSDEFNMLDRDFTNGADDKWTALDAPHFSMVHFLPSQISTVTDDDRNVVRVRTTRQKYGNKTFISGMLQGWNKFCFTGGIVEFSVKFPASPGYWPAVWMFGNLGRAVYEDSCTDVWPWTFDVCSKPLQDALPPNQRQKIQTCDANPGAGLNPNQGRGATEIDIVEGWGGEYPPEGNVMQNFQVAPRIPRYFWPRNGNPPSGSAGAGSWYRGIKYGDNVNPGQWYGHQDEGCNPGTCPDVLGCSIWSTTMGSQYHTVRLEWKIGDEGYMKWYWNNQMTMHIPAKSLTRDYTDPGGAPSAPRQIPSEPMYLMANIAMSDHFAGGQKAVKIDPGDLMIDWIRVYQDPEQINTGCSPSDYPTTEYIEAHQSLYGPPVTPMDACPPERHGLMPQVTLVELGQQAACDPTTNFYSQELLVSFTNLDSITVNHLLINSQNFTLSGTEASPMKFTLVNLLANGQEVNVSASFEGSSSVWFTQSQFKAPSSCALSPTSSGETGQPTPVAPSVLSPTPAVNAPSSGAQANASENLTPWSDAMTIGVIVVTLSLLVLAVGGGYYCVDARKRNRSPFALQQAVYVPIQS